MTAPHPTAFRLQAVSDIVCPWCFIGKRSLDQALTILASQGLDIEIEWLPFQLNPDLPAEGMDRKAFRSIRFGSWETALAMDARAIEAGKKVGADFHYERQTRTSNTLAAHALARLALAEGGPVLQSRVIDALFVAYFTDGADVGDPAVLSRLAAQAGLGDQATDRSTALREEVARLEKIVRGSGLTSVPSYLVDGRLLFGGSQSVEGYVQVLAAASRAN